MRPIDDVVAMPASASSSPGGKRPYRPPVLADLGTLREHLDRWPVGGRHRRWRHDPTEAVDPKTGD